MTPAPHWDDARQQRALLAWTLRSTSASFLAQGFLVYYLLELRANDRLMGLAMALPSLAFAAQFAGSVWAERTSDRQRLCLRLFLAHTIAWVPALAVGFWAAGQPERYGVARVIFIGSLALMGVLFHLHSPAWDVLFSDAVPDRQKSAFFGRWGLWAGIGVSVASVLGGLFVHLVAGDLGGRLYQITLLLVFAAGWACTLGTLWLYRRLDNVPEQHERFSLFELLRLSLQQRNYMLFISVHAVRAVALGVYGPFILVWMCESLKMGILYLSLVTAWHQGMVALSSPFWSRVVKRFGSKPVLTFGLVASMGHTLTYFVYTPENFRWLTVLHWGLLGFIWGSYTVAANTLWYALPQRRARSMQFAIAWSVLGVAGAIGSAAGGWIASHATPVVVGPYEWSKYHWLLLVSVLVHVPCLLLLRRLQEQGAGEPRVMAAWLVRRIMLRRPPG